MTLASFLSDHLHSSLASTAGATASVLAPFADLLSKIVVGVATGVLVWCFTKAISWVARKLHL